MICASCGAADVEAARCTTCDEPALLDGRYRLEAVVGRGAFGTTYRGVRIADEQVVCVKQLHYQQVRSDETVELFRREARVLRQLDHPAIPAYIDDFSAGAGKTFALYLVQQFVDGRSLARELVERRYREDEVLAIVVELLSVLEYLHGLSPSVIHRDIKPGNVMRRASDGILMLVDFGSVRDALVDTQLGGKTITGTFGYMAPEQYYGKASPAADLYSLGVLAAVLLSRQEPAALVDEQHRIAFRPHVTIGRATAALLDRLLATVVSERPQRAADAARLVHHALAELRKPIAPTTTPTPPPSPTPAARPPIPSPLPLPLPLPVAGAEPPVAASARRGALIFVLLCMALPIAIFVGRCACDSPSTLVDRCGGQPCRPVMQGLKGLRFGMTLDEARPLLPELARATVVEAPEIDRFDRLFDPIHFGPKVADGVRYPGNRYTVETTVAGEAAQCVLDFVVDRRLSRMVCSIESTEDEAHHFAVEKAVLDSLVARCGPPRDPPLERRITQPQDGPRYWLDDKARLELTSSFKAGWGSGAYATKSRSTITITNESTANMALRSKLESEAYNKQREAKAQEQREREAARERELEKMRRNRGDMDDL